MLAAIDEGCDVVAVPMGRPQLARADRTGSVLPSKYAKADPRWYGRVIICSDPFIDGSHKYVPNAHLIEFLKCNLLIRHTYP